MSNLDKPLISIIINCRNGQEYLRTALESVLSQTYSNWELIFFDNKSSDDSVKIMEGNDSRIKIFKSKSFLSLYQARNEAMNFCNGEAITFLDTDDIWSKNKLELQVSLFLKGNKFIYGDYLKIDDSNNLLDERIPKPSKSTNELLIRNTISIGCVMIESNLLKNEKFDSFYNLLGDFDLWVRLSRKNNIVHIPSVLEYSRVHSSNLSDQLNTSWKTERRYFYRKYLSNPFLLLKTPAILKYILITEVKGILNMR